jgi:outer membrane protein insertion porin family
LRARLFCSVTPWLLVLAATVTSTQAQSQSSTAIPPPVSTAAAPSLPAASTQTYSNLLSYQGLPVRDLQISGARAGTDSKVWSLIVQPKGEPLDRAKIRQSIKNLYGTGRYTDVAVEAERVPDGGVALTFVFQLNYFIGAVLVDGAPNRPTANQITNVTKFRLGEQLTLDKIVHALDRIRVLMEDNGFYHSTTSYQEQTQAETQQVNIHLQVSPGPAAHVGQIQLTGDAKLSLSEVQEDAHLHPGDRVTADRIRSAMDRLRNKYRKQSRYTAQVSIVDRVYHTESNAVDYTLHIEPGPVVEISVRGAKISRRVQKERIPVYEESAVENDLLDEGRLNLTDYLQTRGYFDALVYVSKQQEPGGKKLLIVYDIVPGARHKLVKLEVKGNQYFPTETLVTRMQVQAAGRLVAHGRFSQSLFDSDVKGLQELYRANGFQKVNITAKAEDNYLGAKDQLAVFVNVEEGPQTLIATSHFAGNRSIPEEDLRNQITSTEGQPYSEYNLSNDRDQVLTEYVNRGYPDARLEISAKPAAEPNRVDVVFDVREGEKVVVAKVLVSGLATTKPKVVDREVRVHAGDALSQRDLFATQQRLYDLGIFSQVDVALQDPEGHELDKNVLVDVREAPRYALNYGFGFEAQTGQPGNSSAQGQTGVSPRVSFDVTRLNFLGLNHTIAFKSNFGALQQRALVSYEAPRFLDNEKLRLTFTTFYDNTLNVSTFTSRRLEGAVQVEHKLDRVNTYLYRFSYRQVKADVVNGFIAPISALSARVGGPGVVYLRDKRDSPIETRKGNNTTFDVSWASRYFASEADFARLLIQNSTYHAIGKKGMVFARSTRLGFEQTFHDTVLPKANVTLLPGEVPIPLPERLFAGGGNSHRGFAINQAGPRDFGSGQPSGGSALFLNSLELRLPPVNWHYVQDNLSFVLFNDIGNVFDTPRHLLEGMGRLHQTGLKDCRTIPAPNPPTTSPCDFNYMVAAIGTGLHYKTPIGPIRLDLGYNLNPAVFPVRNLTGPGIPPTIQPHIETLHRFNFFFSIGQTF